MSQLDDNNAEHVIAYASKSFRGYEKHMGISEKEMAACVFGVKKFRHYIYGMKFKLVTDHHALTYLMSIKDPTGKLARWSIFLSQFDFDIIYRKGAIHHNADYLSRPVLLIQTRNGDCSNMSNGKHMDPWEDGPLLHYLRTKRHLDGSERKQVNRLNKILDKYFYKDDILYELKNNYWL